MTMYQQPQMDFSNILNWMTAIMMLGMGASMPIGVMAQSKSRVLPDKRYKLIVMQMRKPLGSYDNEGDDVSTAFAQSASELVRWLDRELPTIGGTHGIWLEIHEEE